MQDIKRSPEFGASQMIRPAKANTETGSTITGTNQSRLGIMFKFDINNLYSSFVIR